MSPDLSNQIALVTGAGRGIGRCISLALARAGAHVALLARSADQLDALAGEPRAAGGAATPLACDLGDQAQVVAAFDHVGRQLGRLDILINNAAIGLFGPIHDFAVEAFDQVMSINVRGAFLCMRQALRLMMPRRSGYIINIGSVVGFRGYANQGAYSASKHALVGLTKCAAVEAQAHNIRVSAVLPGGVDTEMLGDARPDLDRSVLMKPEDIAQSVLYLLSLSDRAAVDQIYIRRKASSPF